MAANHSSTPTLAEVQQLVGPLGFSLEAEQPHIGGERALLSTKKLVLLGHDTKGTRVVIKISNDKEKMREIEQEKKARDILTHITFAADELLQAKERFAGMRKGYYILITEYIPQDTIFVDFPMEEQFFLALRAFEAQEAHHATTFEHNRQVQKVFDFYTPEKYLATFATCVEDVRRAKTTSDTLATMERAQAFLNEHRIVMERYGNYLNHTDFVPHNMRVRNRALYVLDLASVWFGNKYEGWARFLNYMVVHNPILERLLSEYLEKNRPMEKLALKTMRVYKAGFLIAYYANLLEKTEDDLHALTQVRLTLWTTILDTLLSDKEIPAGLIEEYEKTRGGLRSDEEKERQKEFARA